MIVIEDIVIGARGLGFDYKAGQIGHLPTARHALHALVYYRRYNDDLVFFFDFFQTVILN